MRYLIDIGHPAHVHYYKNFARIVTDRGDCVLFTCRDKEVTVSLLKHYNFHHVNFGKPFTSSIGKIFGLFYFTLRVFLISLKFRPNVFLNASMYSAFVAWLMCKPHIALEDTYNKEQVNLYLPFTSCVLTGDYDHPSLGKKEIKYSGYQELLYLHPNYFIPNEDIFHDLGIEPYTKYVIIRFVSWGASHDIGQGGFSSEQKIGIVKELGKRIRVFISSEGKLPEELEELRIGIAPWKMHDALAFATLFLGEGATMVSECAMLGVPAIYVNTLDVHTIRDQEAKYNLVFSFRNGNNTLSKAFELIEHKNKENWKLKQNNMLADKIDVTAFLIWFVENYPESKKIMRQNPDYQNTFKYF